MKPFFCYFEGEADFESPGLSLGVSRWPRFLTPRKCINSLTTTKGLLDSDPCELYVKACSCCCAERWVPPNCQRPCEML